jgi:uncharacterized protein
MPAPTVTPSLQRPRFADKLPPWFLPDIRHILDTAEAVPINELVTICRDPGDDKFIELAINGRADLIVSGDADLLSFDEVRGIPIVSPAAFVQVGTR